MRRLLRLQPLLPAFVLVWMLSGSAVLPVALLALTLLAPQKRTEKTASVIVPMALAGAVGFFVNRHFAVLRELPIEQAGYQGMVDNLTSTAAALASGAAIRRCWAKPEGGEPLTLGVVLLCIALTALFLPKWAIALAVLWVVLWSLGTMEDARRGLASPRGRRRTATAVLVAMGVATGLALPLPWLQAKALGLMLEAAVRSSSGLGDHISLDFATNLKLSDERVMRLRAEPRSAADSPVDYLRGFVFARYARGEWLPASWPGSAQSPPARASTASGPSGPSPPPRASTASASTTTVELSASNTRVLLPLDSTNLSISASARSVRVDGTGVPIAERPIDGYSFQVGAREAFPIHPPQPEDLLVPAAVREALEPTVKAWTSGMTTPEAQLAAIAEAFHRDFRWSLQSRRATRADPVVDFVLHERVGHCEYFASAMALLARMQGIPARVIGGFRVSEHNALDDSYVVRKSNAHAWVEAWVEGRGWRTYDPTPETEANLRREQGTLAAVLDLARAHPTRSILVLAALLAVAAAAPSLRTRLKTGPTREDEPVLPAVAALVRAIAKRTRRRLPAETLSHWACDVARTEEIAILEHYCRLRWGDAADQAAVEREAARFIEKAG